MNTTTDLLVDLASRWRANADRLELEATGLEEQARGQAGIIGSVENDWSRSDRSQAGKLRQDAAWLRQRAAAASEGKYLFNPTDPGEATDAAEAAVRGRCAAEGRMIALDARQARQARETLAQETV